MTPKQRTLAAMLAVLLLGSAAVTACGTQQADTSASSAASSLAASAPSPTPSADDFIASVMRTRDLATAALEVTVITDVGGSVRTLTGSGVSALGNGYGDLLWTDGSGAVTRELSNGKGLFVQTDVPDGTWIRLPDERATPTGRLADPLRGLGGLADATTAGSEDLDGVPTTRFTGTLPASPESLALLGFSDEELVEIGTDWQGGVVDVTVWIDAKGRVIGIERSLDLPGAASVPVSATTMTSLSDFTTTIDLEPPPTESVVEAPDGQ